MFLSYNSGRDLGEYRAAKVNREKEEEIVTWRGFVGWNYIYTWAVAFPCMWGPRVEVAISRLSDVAPRKRRLGGLVLVPLHLVGTVNGLVKDG